MLDSRPSGADVLDGDQMIGTTPMQVTIDRAGVRSAPRRFVLRLDGYAPYTVVQGDSEGIVHVTAPLDPATPAASASAAASAPTVAAQQPAQPVPVRRPAPPPRAVAVPAGTQHTQQELDIKLQR